MFKTKVTNTHLYFSKASNDLVKFLYDQFGKTRFYNDPQHFKDNFPYLNRVITDLKADLARAEKKISPAPGLNLAAHDLQNIVLLNHDNDEFIHFAGFIHFLISNINHDQTLKHLYNDPNLPFKSPAEFKETVIRIAGFFFSGHWHVYEINGKKHLLLGNDQSHYLFNIHGLKQHFSEANLQHFKPAFKTTVFSKNSLDKLDIKAVPLKSIKEFIDELEHDYSQVELPDPEEIQSPVIPETNPAVSSQPIKSDPQVMQKRMEFNQQFDRHLSDIIAQIIRDELNETQAKTKLIKQVITDLQKYFPGNYKMAANSNLAAIPFRETKMLHERISKLLEKNNGIAAGLAQKTEKDQIAYLQELLANTYAEINRLKNNRDHVKNYFAELKLLRNQVIIIGVYLKNLGWKIKTKPKTARG